jgi:conjugative relaxase-like TrwC/TraI family protein
MTASLGKITDANKAYHLGEIEDRLDPYYLKDRPIRTLGNLAKEVGLGNEPTSEQILNVLAGNNADATETLRERPVKTLGFDLALSARKEISILHALGGEHLRNEIEAAHHTAVEGAFKYLESSAVSVRRGAGGAQVLDGSGLIAFAVTHNDSRNLDPQLHDHVLIANMTKGPDDRWTALDGRDIYRHAKTAGFIYQATLRAELTERVGLVWEPVHNRTAPVAGFDQQLVREFSTRRRSIEEALDRNGLASPKSAAIATLTTRQSKQLDVDLYDLQSNWAQRAEPYRDSLRNLPLQPRHAELTVDARVLAATVTQQHATFDRRTLLQAVCESHVDGARLRDIEREAEAFVRSGHAITLGPDRWTTPEMLALEQRTVDAAINGRNKHLAIVPTHLVDEALASRPSLGQDQADAVTALARSGDAVEIVIGPAGHGKSTMLDASRAAWDAAGFRTIGAAPSARAAAELQASSGIPSQTIDRLFGGIDTGYERLDRQTVLVIDEAGMVGTRKLANIIERAQQTSTKVVLVGDNKQLPEIDAGGLFSALTTRLEPHTLTENRRQQDPVERQAAAELRAGDTEIAIKRLHRHGRIVTADNADHLRDGLVADWHQSRNAGQDVLLVAPRRSMVDDLNDRARELLRATGQLGEPILRLDDHEYAKGDTVVALHNDYRIGILNGDRATVRELTDDGLTVTLRRGGDVTIPLDYAAEHLTHGYATTIHKAQGFTVDEVFVLGDDTYAQEHGYTALTRGRNANRAYIVRAEPPEHALPHADSAQERSPLDAFINSLQHSAAKTAAIDFTPDHNL